MHENGPCQSVRPRYESGKDRRGNEKRSLGHGQRDGNRGTTPSTAHATDYPSEKSARQLRDVLEGADNRSSVAARHRHLQLALHTTLGHRTPGGPGDCSPDHVGRAEVTHASPYFVGHIFHVVVEQLAVQNGFELKLGARSEQWVDPGQHHRPIEYHVGRVGRAHATLGECALHVLGADADLRRSLANFVHPIACRFAGRPMRGTGAFGPFQRWCELSRHFLQQRRPLPHRVGHGGGEHHVRRRRRVGRNHPLGRHEGAEQCVGIGIASLRIFGQQAIDNLG